MKPLAALAWKEWHEARVFLWIGIGVFVGIPLAAGLEAWEVVRRNFSIDATQWVGAFSAPFALLVAIAVSCRDFQGRLEDFWRSRPLGTWQWLIVKYSVGLAVVFITGLVPLILEILIKPNRSMDVAMMMCWLGPAWIGVYGIAFISGRLIRKTAHAVAMALAAILLIYFFLMTLPQSEWIIPILYGYGWRFSPATGIGVYARIVGVPLFFALVLLVAALIAVRRGWHFEFGRGALYGSVSTALVVLMIAAGLQLGTNLPVLYQMDFPDHEQAVLMHCDGTNGFVIMSRTVESADTSGRELAPSNQVLYFTRPFTLTAAGIQLGDAHPSGPMALGGLDSSPSVLSPRNPRILWSVEDDVETYPAETEEITLTRQFLDSNYMGLEIHLWSHRYETAMDFRQHVFIHLLGDRLYVMGPELVTVDISNVDDPRVISRRPISVVTDPVAYTESGELQLYLPPIPELTARQRMDAAISMIHNGSRRGVMDADTLYLARWGELSAWRLTNLTGTIAEFKPIGQYSKSMLQLLFARYGPGADIQLVNGYLFEGASHVHLYGSEYPFSFNPRFTVFDTRGMGLLNPVGHFSAPGAELICPLPDGRSLVAGSKLWIVGPPPGAGPGR